MELDNSRRSQRPKELLLDQKIFTVSDFLSFEECKKIVNCAESKGFNESPSSGGGHGRTGREDPRDNKYQVIVDQNLANQLWERIKPYVPKTANQFLETSTYFNEEGGSEWEASGVVERLRIYKYESGEQYPEHMDGSYKRSIVDKHGESYYQQSFLTLLIYLNDEFEGGKTGFYPNKQHCRYLRDIENKIPSIVITPKTGTALVNIHNILHEGAPVEFGTKYVLRTDILFTKKMPTHPKLEKFKDGNKGTYFTGEWEKIFEPSCKLYHD